MKLRLQKKKYEFYNLSRQLAGLSGLTHIKSIIKLFLPNCVYYLKYEYKKTQNKNLTFFPSLNTSQVYAVWCSRPWSSSQVFVRSAPETHRLIAGHHYFYQAP